MKINVDLIREHIYKKYMPYIKPNNRRKTMSIIHMCMCELGISEKTVYNLLIGRCSLSLLKKVIECYEIDPQEIFIKEN